MNNNCITTYTGRHIDPLHPDPDMICIEDIAHALSLICRGNGQVKTFFQWVSIASTVPEKPLREDILGVWHLPAFCTMPANVIYLMCQDHSRKPSQDIRNRRKICWI